MMIGHMVSYVLTVELDKWETILRADRNYMSLMALEITHLEPSGTSEPEQIDMVA